MTKCVDISDILKKGAVHVDQSTSKVIEIEKSTISPKIIEIEIFSPKIIEIVSTSGGTTTASPFPYIGAANISGSLTVEGPISASTFIGDGSGLTNLDPFPYTGSAQITGSLSVTGSSIFSTEEGGYDFFIIKSGSINNLKFNQEGIAQFHAYENSFMPTPVLGGLFFTSQSLYIGLEK